jgi:hypothetical protein
VQAIPPACYGVIAECRKTVLKNVLSPAKHKVCAFEANKLTFQTPKARNEIEIVHAHVDEFPYVGEATCQEVELSERDIRHQRQCRSMNLHRSVQGWTKPMAQGDLKSESSRSVKLDHFEYSNQGCGVQSHSDG